MAQFDDVSKKLTEVRRSEEEELMKALSLKYGQQYANLYGIVINTDALRLIPEKTARAAELAIFARAGVKISVAIRNPNKQETLSLIETLKGRNYIVTQFMVSTASLEHAWERYRDVVAATASEKGILGIPQADFLKVVESIKKTRDISERVAQIEKAGGVSITGLLSLVFGGAIALDVSDVHIEPEEEIARIRMRLDGVLWDTAEVSRHTCDTMRSRLKLLAGVKLNITDRAQDGRFTIDVQDKEYEVRLSVIPGAYGESIVMRFLDPGDLEVKIEQLGINEFLLPVVYEELKRPNGMIITTGPTGSGKTTSLYTFLRLVHSPEIKIVTIEDPIEYHVPGIVQTQTANKYSFADGLRSILRQDPDVVMVGEVRDHEVAETAMNAALTGHLVFSTLHTNSAAGAFPRLRDLGIDPRTMGSALNLVIAQRLVRRLCPDCKKARPLTRDEKMRFATILDAFTPPSPLESAQVYDAVGCDTCSGSGFKSRIGIYEAIRMDDRVKKAIFDDTREISILDAARPQHLPTMSQDGVLKVLNGITSVDELERMVDLYHHNSQEAVPSEEIAKASQELKTIEDVITHVERLEAEIGRHDASFTLTTLLGGALSLGASDLHIEPREGGGARIRYRIDGVLWDIGIVEAYTYELLRERLKLFARLILNTPGTPQDGRFTITVTGKEYEVRISLIPGGGGESMVMRFLDPSNLEVKIEQLGINKFLLAVIIEELKRPNGMIITTGPTGSGKTTALYTFLRLVHAPEVKIITLEDPIEYHLPGIVQTQIKGDYTFANGLRSILRQDPNIILVGEIRDNEVAGMAASAALTGHLVFSTLHTNSAAGAFPRLQDLGIDPRTMGSALNLVMAQRLVRKLCPICKKERPLAKEEQDRFELILKGYPEPVELQGAHAYDAVGCTACGGSGYKGRVGVYEGIRMTFKVSEAILSDMREPIILEAARDQKLPTMQQDGIIKVLTGMTALSELERVVDLRKEGMMGSPGTTAPS